MSEKKEGKECKEALYQDQNGNPTCLALRSFMDESTEVQHRIEQKVDNMLDKMRSAFPNGDIEGHRRYHELKIEELAERRRLRVAIQEKTISSLLWSGIILIAAAIANYLGFNVGGPK